ncbi:MFS transporter [Puerhibacterium puerhi]|uniref:MFS transporter n=1 Tax=Puerhibacterium puerhi TaxID=2692623 RepID=UPI001915AEBE|nr:MFS transporter [Puerhibacterium puerhi]
MIETFWPRERVARSLTLSTMAFALSSGVFYTVSTLYFTRVVGLAPTTVGLGLGVAGGAGVLAAYGAGRLADRVGAHRVQWVATALNGLAMLAYTAAHSAAAFVVVACFAVAMRSASGSAKQAVLARWYVGPERVAVRARMRVVTNVCIGLGTVAAGAALLVDTAVAYQAAMLAVAVLLLAAVLPLARLGRVPGLAARMLEHRSDDGAGRSRGPSPLRDRTYVASVALNSVLAMHFGLQTVGVPLWIASTGAPTVMVSLLLVLNTAVVALLQVRASRGTDDVRRAGLTVRRASWLLAGACLAYALAGYGSVATACVLLVVAALAHSLGEILGEAGGWGMAFELADPRSAGAYQGLSQTGYAVASMVAPPLVTATAIEHGTVGWVGLGVVFLAAGAGAAALVRHGRPGGGPGAVTTAAPSAPSATEAGDPAGGGPGLPTRVG